MISEYLLEMKTKEELYKNLYILIDILYPENYEVLHDFIYEPRYKNGKTLLRPSTSLFSNDIYDIFDIFLWKENNIFFSKDGYAYSKVITSDEYLILKEANDINKIKRILKQASQIKNNIDDLDMLIKSNIELSNTNLQKYYIILKDLFAFEVQALIEDEIKEAYYNEFRLADHTLPLYLPNNLKFYFFIKEINKLMLNNDTHINIDKLMIFLKTYEKYYELNTNLERFCFSISFFYFNLSDTKYTIDDNIIIDNEIELNKIKEIINNSYNNYNIFIDNYKKENTMKGKIKLFLENGLHINSFKDILSEFTYKFYLEKNKGRKRKYNNITRKENIKTKGGRGKTKKHRGTL